MRYTKKEIETAISAASAKISPTIMRTLIENIYKYQDELKNLDNEFGLTDDIASNALLMGIMFTAIQTNTQILREVLYDLMGE